MGRQASGLRKGRITSIACNSCREKRAKCDGKQPCERCSRQETDCCYIKRRTESKESLRKEIERLQLELHQVTKSFEAFKAASSAGGPTCPLQRQQMPTSKVRGSSCQRPRPPEMQRPYEYDNGQLWSTSKLENSSASTAVPLAPISTSFPDVVPDSSLNHCLNFFGKPPWIHLDLQPSPLTREMEFVTDPWTTSRQDNTATW